VALGIVAALGFLWWQRQLLWRSVLDLRDLRWEWALAAIAAESASMATFARMQARLVRAGGSRLHISSAVAITYAGNAISVSLPLAGSELSVGYTYRQYLARGFDAATAAWALVVGGVASTVALSVVVGVAAISSGNPGLATAGAVAAGLLVVGSVMIGASLRIARLATLVERVATLAVRAAQRVRLPPAGDPQQVVHKARRNLTSLHLTPVDWMIVAILATTNWAADAACLICCLRGLGLHLSLARAVLAWSGGSAAASLGLTPGGIGVVEAALVASLAAAGVHSSVATSAVFAYRLISLWLVLAVGWGVYLVLRRHQATSRSEPARADASGPTATD